MGRKQFKTQAVATAALAGVWAATPGVAAAHDNLGNSPNWWADNNSHDICPVDLTPRMQEAVDWAIAIVDQVRDLSAQERCGDDATQRDQDYCDYDGRVWDGCTDPRTGERGVVIGLHKCTLQSQKHCKASTQRYDISWSEWSGPESRKNLALHEIGHSLGLHHSQASLSYVMHEIVQRNVAYDPDELGHLNDHY